MTRLVTRLADLADAAGLTAPRAVVMTLGALHEGHSALVREARRRVGPAGTVVVTIFVNPLQFGPGEDYDRYPRTLEADLVRCRADGVDVVLAPERAEVFPHPPAVRVSAGPLGNQLEGASRPGHFDGVLTVVLTLLHVVRPEVAVFGEKDYQQLALVQAMARELHTGVEIVPVATVRGPDGLAVSSRNRYLSPDERTAAGALPRALEAGARVADDGADAVLGAARAVLDDAEGVDVDYLELRDPQLGPAPESGPARLLVAARVGGTRLIDNVGLLLASAGAGTRGSYATARR